MTSAKIAPMAKFLEYITASKDQMVCFSSVSGCSSPRVEVIGKPSIMVDNGGQCFFACQDPILAKAAEPTTAPHTVTILRTSTRKGTGS